MDDPVAGTERRCDEGHDDPHGDSRGYFEEYTSDVRKRRQWRGGRDRRRGDSRRDAIRRDDGRPEGFASGRRGRGGDPEREEGGRSRSGGSDFGTADVSR